MYIITHLYVVKDSWSSKILKKFWNILWIFKVLKFHIFKNMSVFLMWLICSYHLYFFNESKNIIWVNLIVLCKIDSIWHNKCTFSNILNQNQNLKLYQINFYSKLFDIHMRKKTNLPWLLWFKMVIKKKCLILIDYV